MAYSKQNKVPFEYDKFYTPMLKLKQALQSSSPVLELDKDQFIIRGLMILHYATFFMCNVLRMTNNADNTKVLLVRSLVENMLKKGTFKLEATYSSKLVSLIDSVAKYLNTTVMPKLHIAMYHGYLDYEIYYNFNKKLGLFDFKWCCTIEDETAKRMKEYHDASLALINEVKVANLEI